MKKLILIYLLILLCLDWSTSAKVGKEHHIPAFLANFSTLTRATIVEIKEGCDTAIEQLTYFEVTGPKFEELKESCSKFNETSVRYTRLEAELHVSMLTHNDEEVLKLATEYFKTYEIFKKEASELINELNLAFEYLRQIQSTP